MSKKVNRETPTRTRTSRQQDERRKKNRKKKNERGMEGRGRANQALATVGHTHAHLTFAEELHDQTPGSPASSGHGNLLGGARVSGDDGDGVRSAAASSSVVDGAVGSHLLHLVVVGTAGRQGGRAHAAPKARGGVADRSAGG